MKTSLQIAADLELPLDAATDTRGILAKKGSGKSTAAVVLAEEMHAAGIPWVAIDPKGDWYGVRSSADGQSEGLAVPVFGGKHGDLPLEATAGHLVADLILGDDQRGYLTCVLDVSQFTISEQRRFLLAFGERLYRQKDEEGVLHLFLEEAHEYLPQSVPRDYAPLVSTWQRIVKLGRTKGLGITLVSQRSAALNKDVLTQVDELIVLRTLSPQDRAVVKAWLDVHVGVTEVINTLHELAKGEAWMWAPDRFAAPRRFQFRRRHTFDSGATPEVGRARRAPATLADVDLAAIKEQMAETIEKVKADDPKELRKRISLLERDLAEARAATPDPVIEEVVVEVVPVGFHDALERIEGRLRDLDSSMDDLIALRGLLQATPHRPGGAAGRLPTPPADRQDDRGDIPAPARPSRPTRRAAPSADSSLPGPQRKLLTVLATHGPRTKRQLALTAGYSMSGGGFNNPLGALRSSGFVDRGDPIVITQAGLDALGDYEPLPSGRALLAHWLEQLPGPASKILAAIAARWPESYTKDELAAVTGYSPVGGGFNNPLGRLRTLELITRGADIRLTDDFGEAIS